MEGFAIASGIYQITNRENGKRYIGSAVNLKKRWRNHLGALRRGQHSNPHLQAAFLVYGEQAFMFSILKRVAPEKLIEHEQRFLDTLLPEYNIAPMASNSMLGRQHTAETRVKMSEAMTGKHPSEEARRKMSEAHRGKHFSPETRAKMSAAWTPDHRQAQSEAHMGKHHSDETRAKISEARKAWWRRYRLSTND